MVWEDVVGKSLGAVGLLNAMFTDLDDIAFGC